MQYLRLICTKILLSEYNFITYCVFYLQSYSHTILLPLLLGLEFENQYCSELVLVDSRTHHRFILVRYFRITHTYTHTHTYTTRY